MKNKNWVTKIKEHKLATFLIVALMAFLLLPAPDNTAETEITPYITFQEHLTNGDVTNIAYDTGETMTVTLKDGTSFVTSYPAYENFRKDMLEANVELTVLKTDPSARSFIGDLISIMISFLPILLIFKLIKSQGAETELSENDMLQTSSVKFSDVIGQDEIVDDIMFAANILKNPSIGDELGAKPPKGILFEGDPGSGKTMIAKAVAGEAGVPFISVSGSSFIEKYVGVGASRVRQVFKIAKKHAPCVVFIDEIDAVGAQRSSGSSSERDQTINALLTELDGFSGREGILVIAATNRADMLDEALVRSGRFDRKITVNKPKNWTVRMQMFEKFLENKKLAEDVDLDCLAKQVAGYSGADIASVCNEATNIALQRGFNAITMDCLEEAIDKKTFSGNRIKDAKQTNQDREIVAYHEAGHAVMTYLLGQPIARASIIGTTSGVGGAVFREDSNSQFMTKKDVEEYVKIAYAGRASEEIKFGKDNVTTGASNDITQATKILTNAVIRYGFYTEDAGMLDMSVLADFGINAGENEALKLVRAESKALYETTIQMLTEHSHLVSALATELLNVETMSGEDVIACLQSA